MISRVAVLAALALSCSSPETVHVETYPPDAGCPPVDCSALGGVCTGHSCIVQGCPLDDGDPCSVDYVFSSDCGHVWEAECGGS